MRVAVPHRLGREEVQRRLRGRAHELADVIPGGMADVTERWPSENRLELAVAAMGQTIAASVDIAEHEAVIEVNLPSALSFVEPLIKGAIEAKGRKLLT